MKARTMRAFAILIAAGAVMVFCVLHFAPPSSIALSTPITNVANGYSLALQIKNRMDRKANLTAVVVYLERRSSEFQVRQIGYGFSSPEPHGRTFGVNVDNLRSEVYGLFDAPFSPDAVPQMSARRAVALNLSSIKSEVPEILAAAQVHGLAEFCSLSSPEQGIVKLTLFQEDGPPVWLIQGDAWNQGRPLAELSIKMNAETGDVISHNVWVGKHR
jgi:hypothetical protein